MPKPSRQYKDWIYTINVYQCRKCGKEVHESYPHEVINDEVWCGDCAYIEGLITDQEYRQNYCRWIDIDGFRTKVWKGKIYTGVNKFPWERTSRKRDCKEYSDWRLSVFERDRYTCQKCGKIGGTLNAHHIKSYKDYPELRYEISNGQTLCEDCHRNIHKELRLSK